MTGHTARGSKNTGKVAEKETNFFQEKFHREEARAKVEDNGLGRKEFRAEGMTKQGKQAFGNGRVHAYGLVRAEAWFPVGHDDSEVSVGHPVEVSAAEHVASAPPGRYGEPRAAVLNNGEDDW